MCLKCVLQLFYKFWNYYLVVNGVAYQYHWPDNRNTTWYPSSLPVVPYELITTSATRLCSPHWGSFQSWNAKVWLSAPLVTLRFSLLTVTMTPAHCHDGYSFPWTMILRAVRMIGSENCDLSRFLTCPHNVRPLQCLKINVKFRLLLTTLSTWFSCYLYFSLTTWSNALNKKLKMVTP